MSYLPGCRVGLVSPNGSKIDFKGASFLKASRFFVVILKFIFKSIFEIKITKKKFLDTKKISFSKAYFE